MTNRQLDLQRVDKLAVLPEQGIYIRQRKLTEIRASYDKLRYSNSPYRIALGLPNSKPKTVKTKREAWNEPASRKLREVSPTKVWEKFTIE